MIQIAQMARYALVGGAMGALWVGLLIALSRAGFPEWAASSIAFCVCVPLAYMGHRRITFRSNGCISTEARRFLVKAAAGLALSAAVPAAVAAAGHGVAASAVLTPAAVAAMGFLVSRLWVFRPEAP